MLHKFLDSRIFTEGTRSILLKAYSTQRLFWQKACRLFTRKSLISMSTKYLTDYAVLIFPVSVSFPEFENNFLTIFHHSFKKMLSQLSFKTNKQKQDEAKIIVGYWIFLKVAGFLFSHSMQHTLDCIFQWKLTMNIFPLCAPSTYILPLWLEGPYKE